MAKGIINIDGETTVVDSDTTIRDALDQAGIDNVPSAVSGGEVITAERPGTWVTKKSGDMGYTF